jgi:hypothetical protein
MDKNTRLNNSQISDRLYNPQPFSKRDSKTFGNLSFFQGVQKEGIARIYRDQPYQYPLYSYKLLASSRRPFPFYTATYAKRLLSSPILRPLLKLPYKKGIIRRVRRLRARLSRRAPNYLHQSSYRQLIKRKR